MPGQRVVRSMIGELAVALASAVEAALALAADNPDTRVSNGSGLD